MPADLPMLPINQLAIGLFRSFAPGALLASAISSEAAPCLVVIDPTDDDEDERYSLSLADAPARGGAFALTRVERSSTTWLAVTGWRLIVDPTSAYLGTADFPRRGDAFVSAGEPGLVGKWPQGEGYISLCGDVLPEPNFASSYVGFRSWSIVVDVDGVELPHPILSHARQRP